MTYSTEEKARWLGGWKASGKKAWAYAKENGLIPQTFTSWTKKKEKTSPGFIEVHTKVKPLPSEITVERGDIKVRIQAGINSEQLGMVIKSLRGHYDNRPE